MRPNKGETCKEATQAESRPSGVFLIRNVGNDKVFLGVGLDLQGIVNRHKFQLMQGIHSNVQLQNDWDELGPESFAFEILEETNLSEHTQSKQQKELAFMEKLWLERLQPFGERGYNQPKLSREEKLRRIAANRRGEF